MKYTTGAHRNSMNFFPALIPFCAILISSSHSLNATETTKEITPNTTPQFDLCATINPEQLLTDTQSIHISAQQLELINNDQATFNGKVEICSNQLQVSSDRAELSRSQGYVNADGNIYYTNDSIHINSENFQANVNQNLVKLDQADYQLTMNNARGQAEVIEISAENLLLLTDATFTTCPVEQEDWVLSAKRISLSSQQGWGVAQGAAIKINQTPVLYIPYIAFPLDDRRTTGFLYPNNITSSQKNGIELETPWYWNIAPNYDATFTPRAFSKRGIQLNTELRYLNPDDQGLIQLEYLNNDRDSPNLGSRHLLYWKHYSQFTEKLRGFINFTQLSDDNYFTELGSYHHSSTDTQITQQLELSYFGDSIDGAFRIQNFEVLGQHPSSYRTLPQIELSNHKPYQFGEFELDWLAELSHFANSEKTIHEANRLHIEPSISYQFNTPAWSLNSNLSLLQTHYKQHLFNGTKQRISRTLPKFRIHSKINFERPAGLFNQLGILTFEPQFQYLYIPFKDQSTIGLFDSSRLQDDYYGLFRDNRFSGLDRIADANQMTLGATTRFINQQNLTLMRLSFGQIFYLDHDYHQFTANDQRLNRSNSALAGEVFINLASGWSFNSNIQFDTTKNQTNKSNMTLDYRTDEYTLAQLNHRRTRDISDNDIEQLGLIASFPIAKHWQFVGGYHRDLKQHRSIDYYAGVQYDACCWAIRLVTRRHINTNLEQLSRINTDTPSSFDSGISLQFVIKGLSSNLDFDISDMLQQGIFGYRRPYFTNN